MKQRYVIDAGATGCVSSDNSCYIGRAADIHQVQGALCDASQENITTTHQKASVILPTAGRE